jgi:hypothetical protein
MNYELPERGVSVSLDERHLALESLAKVYARHASAQGLEKAVRYPAHRQRIAKRYGPVEHVVQGANQKTLQALHDAEAEFMPVLTKQEELAAAGFDPVDAETTALTTTIQVRHAIGHQVGEAKRNEILERTATLGLDGQKPLET